MNRFLADISVRSNPTKCLFWLYKTWHVWDQSVQQTFCLILQTKSLLTQVLDKLRRYERETKNLDMLLTPECLATIACFDHALARPGGAMLLNGACGVGRRTALTLVAYAQHLDIMSPACTVGFGVKQFRTFLKACFCSMALYSAVPVVKF